MDLEYGGVRELPGVTPKAPDDALVAAQAVESLGNAQQLARSLPRLWDSALAYCRVMSQQFDPEEAERQVGSWKAARAVAERILAGPKVDRTAAMAKRKTAAAKVPETAAASA